MEYQESESFRKEESHHGYGGQCITKTHLWLPNFSYSQTNQLTKELLSENQQNFSTPCTTNLDDQSKFKSNKINTIFVGEDKVKAEQKYNECTTYASSFSRRKSNDGLPMPADLPDLSFLTNDVVLGDCNYFEQASQLVDPALNDSESTPFSFNNNNNDLVQLFRLGLTESRDDNVNNTLTGKNCDDLIRSKNLPEKCDRILHKSDTTTIISTTDCNNFQKTVKLQDTNANTNNKIQNEKEVSSKSHKKKKERRVQGRPIKRGRRYLPNFKKEVLEYAKNHTFKETALHFQINSNTITEWFRENGRTKTFAANDTGSGAIIEKLSSNYTTHKTDTHSTPKAKTEVILLNDDPSLETDYNEASFKNIQEDLPSSPPSSSPTSSSSFSPSPTDVRPEERFLKWIKKKRLQRRELSRQEVFHIAKYCLKKWPPAEDTSGWFVLWLKRYNRVLNSVNTNIEMEKYIKYPNSFKLEVVLYARRFTKNSAARVFNVSRKRTFDWFGRLVSADKLDEMDANRPEEVDNLNFSKKDQTKDKIYTELHSWYQKMFLNGVRPTSNDIKKKAKEIFTSHGLKEIKFSDGWLQKFCQRTNIKLRHNEDDRLLLWILTQFDNNVSLSHQEITEKASSLVGNKNFKGSKGWTLRFLKRHKNLLQRCPTFADQLPRIAQERLTTFWHGFKQNLVSLTVKEDNIGCMDEIPLSFNYPEEGKAMSLPLLRKTGFENCQGIVILSMLANGRLLPPAVVFKGTDLKQLLSGSNHDMLILHQEKGHITEDILETWVNDIWLSCTPSPSALVVDSFEPHRATAFAKLLEKENCSLHVIPDGCSCKFQPLDVEVTPTFKEAIRDQWRKFLSVGSGPCSSRRHLWPDRDTILSWIQNAYEKVNRNPVSILNSFKTTGLL